MAYNGVVHTATGAALKYGHGTFTNDYDPGTETIVSLNKSSVPVVGIPLYYNKVVSGDFTEMSSGEKAAVDAAGISPPATSGDVIDFVDETAHVVDSASGMEGPFHLMQTLINRRELYNDAENPLYLSSGFTPIVGSSGYLEDHADRLENLENIHSGLAGLDWHNQEVQEAKYTRPEGLLIYYGWPNSFNSGVNGWSNELVAQDMAKSKLIVLGATLEVSLDSGTHTGSDDASTLTDSAQSWTTNEFVGKKIVNLTDGSWGSITANTATTVTATLANGVGNDWDTNDAYAIGNHADYGNLYQIVKRIKALNPGSKVFGYVSTNQALAAFQTKVDDWNMLGVSGIFMDESGYDYGSVATNGRAAFNTKVDYVHGMSSANTCFANAWNVDHVLGIADDASYPNSTWNLAEVASQLTQNDWYLLESYPINTTAYSGTGGYESKSDWITRGWKAVVHRYNLGINLAGVGIINNDNGNGADLFDFGYIAACMQSLEAFGTSDTSYGASSATVTWWTRPDVSAVGNLWKLAPDTEDHGTDSDICFRYVAHGRLWLDFSSSAQDSGADDW